MAQKTKGNYMSDDYLNILEIPNFETIDELRKHARENWLQYIDCDRKCSFTTVCPYIDHNPEIRNPDRLCGFMTISLDTILKYVEDKYTKYSLKERDDFAHGLYWYLEYEFYSIIRVGFSVNEDWLYMFEDYYGHVLAQITKEKTAIERIGFYWKNVPKFDFHENILFVEGKSEKAFIDGLKKTHIYNYTSINIKVYGGRGNIRPERAEMLIEDYYRKGFEIKIEGDQDGRKKELFKKFIDNNLIKIENTFLFEYDFESSIPDRIMGYILVEIGIFKKSIKEYCEIVQNRRPINDILKRNGVDITKYKVKIAEKMGEILSDHKNWKLLNSEKFLNETEIGRFIKFIR
jgi:hypothetical protein